MGINRPTNLNIRDVPGNGSIVGPSTSPSCVCITTVCEACYNTCDACALAFDSTVLGCANTFCGCPCCDIVCSCDCTVCDRTVPSGMWKPSEQYEAKERDAWGDDTCFTGAESCLCNINSGYTNKSACNVPTGGYIICHSAGVGWIVAPSSTEVSRTWYSRSDATTTANASAACGDWFVPNISQLQNPGWPCRTYWDSYSTTSYWSNSECISSLGGSVIFSNGFTYARDKNGTRCVRAFRCVSY